MTRAHPDGSGPSPRMPAAPVFSESIGGRSERCRIGPRWDFNSWRYWTADEQLAARFADLPFRIMGKNIQIIEFPTEWRLMNWAVVVFFADCHFDLKYKGALYRTLDAALDQAFEFAREEVPGAVIEQWCGADSWIAERKGGQGIVIQVVLQ